MSVLFMNVPTAMPGGGGPGGGGGGAFAPTVTLRVAAVFGSVKVTMISLFFAAPAGSATVPVVVAATGAPRW